MTRWSAAFTSSKSAFKNGEILFVKLRPYFHNPGLAPFVDICSTDILALALKSHDLVCVLLAPMN
jgi:type I restriction enzyme S subunit